MATIPLLHLTLRPTPTAITTQHRHLKPLSPPPSPLFHPLEPTSTAFLTTKTRPYKTSKPSFMVKSSSSSATTPATDRLISAVGYLLPFFDGLHYGRFLLTQYPSLSLLLEPIVPFFTLYKTLPLASFVAFFGLYLGVVRNPRLSHYVRFNAMQALVLDVLLVLPLFFQRIFSPGRNGVGFKLMVLSHNTVFVFLLLCFAYSFVSSVLGKTPYLPFVADAAGRQL